MRKGFFLLKERCLLLFLSLILFLTFSQTAFSDTPQLISFQGRIVDANSQPLADGNYSMTFKIFNVSVGGAALWTETQGTVAVANGLFSVLLGSVTSLSSLGFNENYWLEITVGASTYTPRQQISAAAYALNIPDLRVTTAKIAPGTAGQILMSNGTPATTWTSMSGDATINSSGVVAIAAEAVALGTDTTGNYAGSNAEGGSATNAFACSADGTCEIQSGIQSISNNNISIDALNTGATSTITLTNSNAGNVANVNVADGALQIGGTSVIDSSRNVANVVNLTNTGNTSLGDTGTDTLTVYPNTMNLTGNVGKTIDVGSGALDTTLTVTNSGAGTANLSVEGSVTATSFSGSASNALACSGDATCEANAITVTNDVTVSSGSVTVSTGNISVSTGNVTIAGTINTGIAATEVYQMNQAVRTTDAVTFLTVDTGQGANELYDMDQNVMTSSNVSFVNVTATGNTQIGNATGDLLNVYPAIFDWNDVDENKTIYVGSGVTDRTLTLTNPDATGKANLTVEGTVTAFAFSGSSTNALACSGDATCEVQSIQSTGTGLTVDVPNAAADSTLTLTNSNATYKAKLAIEDANTVLSQGAGNSLRVTTNSGYTEVGPQNASWSHFMTDRAAFYFNAPVVPDGNTYPYTDNTRTLGSSTNRWASVWAPTFTNSNSLTIDAANAAATTVTVTNSGAGVAALSVEGNATITGGTTTLNNGTSNLINFGSVGVAAPSAASAGWKIKTYGNSYGLGIEGSTQWFSSGRYYKFYNSDGSTYWKNRIMFDTSDTLTYPQVYAYDTAAAATLVEFKTGMYNNGGTLYSENQIYSRTGIANDSASTSGYLNLNDDVLVSGGGWLRVDGSEGLYFETYGGGWRMTDTTWIRAYNDKYVYTGGWIRADSGFDKGGVPIVKEVAYSQGANTTCGTSGWAVVACYPSGAGGNLGNPDNGCPWSGNMICIWTDSF